MKFYSFREKYLVFQRISPYSGSADFAAENDETPEQLREEIWDELNEFYPMEPGDPSDLMMAVLNQKLGTGYERNAKICADFYKDPEADLYDREMLFRVLRAAKFVKIFLKRRSDRQERSEGGKPTASKTTGKVRGKYVVEKGASDVEIKALNEAIIKAFGQNIYLSKNFSVGYENNILYINHKGGRRALDLMVHVNKVPLGKGILNHVYFHSAGNMEASISIRRSPQEAVTAIENLMRKVEMKEAQLSARLEATQKAFKSSTYLNKNFDVDHKGKTLILYNKNDSKNPVLKIHISRFSKGKNVLAEITQYGDGQFYGFASREEAPNRIVTAIEDLMRKYLKKRNNN